MALKITLSDTVKIKVSGTLAGADGPEPFDFFFTAKRLSTDELQRATQSDDATIGDFLGSVVLNWSGVKGDTGEVPYSREALEMLCSSIPGIAGLMFQAYLTDCGARRKN